MDTKELQTWLRNQGYYKGDIDGVYGEQTKEAVREAQTWMKELGLYKGGIDGIYGKDTENAIKTLSSDAWAIKALATRLGIHKQDTPSLSEAEDRINRTIESTKDKVIRPIKSKGTEFLRQFKKYYMQSGGTIPPICGWDE